MAIGVGALRRGLLSRAASNIGIAGAKVGENAIVGNLANGTLVSVGIEVGAGNFTATVFGVAGSSGNATSLLPLAKGLIRAAQAEGASSLTIVADSVGNPQLAQSLLQHGFTAAGNSVVRGVAVTTFVRTIPVR